jgi:hypothetical protein
MAITETCSNVTYLQVWREQVTASGSHGSTSEPNVKRHFRKKLKWNKLGHRVGRWVMNRWMEAWISEGRSEFGE